MISWRIRYLTKDEKDETRIERNERFEKSADLPPGSLTPEEPETPPEADYLLELFDELQTMRNPEHGLSWADVGEWSRMTGANLSPLEMKLIVAMESALKAALSEERKELNQRLKEQSKENRKNG